MLTNNYLINNSLNISGVKLNNLTKQLRVMNGRVVKLCI